MAYKRVKFLLNLLFFKYEGFVCNFYKNEFIFLFVSALDKKKKPDHNNIFFFLSSAFFDFLFRYLQKL